MFEDILEYKKDTLPAEIDEVVIDDNLCPSCGSDNTGASAGPTHIQMFCVDCGHMWTV